MKRCAVVCVFVLLWSSLALAQDTGPNPRQSVAYCIAFMQENAKQLVKVNEAIAQEKNDPKYPFTEKFFFYVDLANRIGQSNLLAQNLCDLYYIYHRTTYCFAKEEKGYLLSRLGNVSAALQTIIKRPFFPLVQAEQADKKTMQAEQDAFVQHVRQLIAFVKTSLPAIRR